MGGCCCGESWFCGVCLVELQRLSFFWVASQSPFELKDAHHHHYQQLHIVD
jgi:hypothetical protein